MSYTLSPDGKSITCRECGLTSINRSDVHNRYCGYCHRFHEPFPRAVPEFDCRDCGRHIVVLCGPATDLCGACRVMPGWWRDPDLARMLGYDR